MRSVLILEVILTQRLSIHDRSVLIREVMYLDSLAHNRFDPGASTQQTRPASLLQGFRFRSYESRG